MSLLLSDRYNLKLQAALNLEAALDKNFKNITEVTDLSEVDEHLGKIKIYPNTIQIAFNNIIINDYFNGYGQEMASAIADAYKLPQALEVIQDGDNAHIIIPESAYKLISTKSVPEIIVSAPLQSPPMAIRGAEVRRELFPEGLNDNEDVLDVDTTASSEVLALGSSGETSPLSTEALALRQPSPLNVGASEQSWLVRVSPGGQSPASTATTIANILVSKEENAAIPRAMSPLKFA